MLVGEPLREPQRVRQVSPRSGDPRQPSLRRTFRDFLDKAQASGPNTVAFVYLSGYGLQLEGELGVPWLRLDPASGELDLDSLTPIQALIRLSELQKEARG